MNYLYHLLTLTFIYALLGMSQNIILGHTGRLSLCQAAFFGTGAYTTAILMTRAGWSFLPSALAGALLSAGLATLVGFLSLRLRGDFFVLGSFGFQVVAFSIFHNLSITGGPYGISSIPGIRWFSIELETPGEYFIVTSVVLALCGGLLAVLLGAPFGRALHTLRDDSVVAAALGYDATTLTLWAFGLSGLVAAVAGALYATYAKFIDPGSFSTLESVALVSIVVIGGAGTRWGPLAGAVFVVGVPEYLQLLDLGIPATANLRQVGYGLMLILLMRWRSRGLCGGLRLDSIRWTPLA